MYEKSWHKKTGLSKAVLEGRGFRPQIFDKNGSCRIFNPASGYKLIVTHPNYEAAQDWLLEDEYERVKGKVLAEDVDSTGESPHLPIK